jgi:hypothetical protein
MLEMHAKLTRPIASGYVMCYVCRKGIAAEKYSHFCQHPRVPPATSCQECNKCDLWKTGDDAAAARQAAELARREWLHLNSELDKEGTTDRVSASAGLLMPEGGLLPPEHNGGHAHFALCPDQVR